MANRTTFSDNFIFTSTCSKNCFHDCTRYALELADTREAVDQSVHRVRLTKGRRKAPAEDIDRGDLYFTDSESEDEGMCTSSLYTCLHVSE